MTEHVETPQEEHAVYEFFLWSVLAKGAISLIEVISGLATFLIPPAYIVSGATWLLSYLPLPPLQHALMTEVGNYTTGAVTFVAAYLISRGLIKAWLIWSLLKDRLWAYPASLLVLGGFVLYQCYQILTDHSIIVAGITIFDLIVMYFIWREWRIVKRHRAHTA